LLQQCRFKEAEQVYRTIERLDGIEREQARKSFQKDYAESVRKMSEKHDSEVEFLETRKVVKQAQLLRDRETQRMVLLNRQKKIEKKGKDAEDKEKIWAQRSTTQTRSATRVVARKGASEPIRFAENPLTTIELDPFILDPSPRRRPTAH
jgi:hypothetical protein